MSVDPENQSSQVGQRRPGQPFRRIAAVLIVLAVLYAAAQYFGLHAYFDRQRIQEQAQAAGGWGFALFLLIFCLGQLVHIPGLVFVAAATVLYPPEIGIAAALLGAWVAVTVSFIVVRAVGGQPLEQLESPWARRLLGHLGARPVRIVAALRLMLWMTPALNYTLALTRLRLRDYVLGSGLGLVLPILGWSLVFYAGWVTLD